MEPGELQPFLRNYGDPRPPGSERWFIERFLEALYGKPGALRDVAGRWQGDPAAMEAMLAAYLRAQPGGFAKAIDAFFRMVHGGAQLANATFAGAIDAALEDPVRPGTISPNNRLAVFLRERGAMNVLYLLRPRLNALNTKDRIPATIEAVQDVVKLFENSILAMTDQQRQKLLAASPTEFGAILGDMQGQLAGEAVLGVVGDEVIKSLRVATPDGDVMRMAIVPEIPGLTPRARAELREEVQPIVRQILAESDLRPEPGGPQRVPAGRDAARRAEAPDAPVRDGQLLVPRYDIVAAPITKAEAEMVRLARQYMAGHEWADAIPDAALLDLLRNFHRMDPSSKNRLSRASGLLQELAIPHMPQFKALHAELRALYANDDVWDVNSLSYAYRVSSLEPIEGTAGGQWQQFTDGVFLIRAKDPKARPQYKVAALCESKSSSNVLDLVFKREGGRNVPQSGQFARGYERYSETDVRFVLDAPDQTRVEIEIPAGQLVINKFGQKPTIPVIVSPKQLPDTPRIRKLLDEIGISMGTIRQWQPESRYQLEVTTQKLLDAIDSGRLAPRVPDAVPAGR